MVVLPLLSIDLNPVQLPVSYVDFILSNIPLMKYVCETN